ncbi:MAG TPA: recombinase RecT [Candidatus Omnitrophota bacterium]|nr:recombinase RecT [Candidatus Omnitrophota bacterium]
MNNQPKPQKARFSVAITTPQYQKLIASTLSDPNRIRTFTAAITSAVAVNPGLQECESSSIIAGALLGESLDLSPSPQLGQYYLVPFDNKLKGPDGKVIYLTDANGQKLTDKNNRWIPQTVKNATFVLGYRGYIQLAIRSGYYLDIDAVEIHEGEYKGRDKFTGKSVFEFVEDDAERDALPVIGYMSYFEYLNGFKKVLYWSKEKMLQHANTYSPAFSAEAYIKLQNNEIPQDEMWKYSSYWYKSFGDMALKTMLRQLISKWGVMSAQLKRAFDGDSYVIKNDNGNLLPEVAEIPEAAQEQHEQQEPQKISMNDV